MSSVLAKGNRKPKITRN